MVGACGYGYLYGNPALLATTWDGDKLGCGLNETRKDYPFLYFPMIDYKNARDAVKDGQKASEDENKEAGKDAARKALQALMKFGTCVKECPRYDSKLSKEEQFAPPKCAELKAMTEPGSPF